MEHELYKSILWFYKTLGVDVLFDSISPPDSCIDSERNVTRFSSINNINKSIGLGNNIKDNIDNDIQNKHLNYNNITVNDFAVNNTNTLVNDNNKINDNINEINHIINKYNNNPQLQQLLIDISNIDCVIKHTARNTVVFDGDVSSNIMIIGEAPGQEEDIQGKPFVGQSGILLNNMLRAIDLSRQDVIISNIVFWRPPFNRNPSTEEISLCLPYVHRLIKIIQPKALLLLGAIANHALLNTMAPMSKLRGLINNVLGIKAISTYHPAYLLRSSTQKKYAFRDFLLLKQTINNIV